VRSGLVALHVELVRPLARLVTAGTPRSRADAASCRVQSLTAKTAAASWKMASQPPGFV
jgi:hypothetical protein